MVLLESQLTDHRESQNHWIAGDPVGQIMVYEQRLWSAGTIANTLLKAFPSLDWTLTQGKPPANPLAESSTSESGYTVPGESGQKSIRNNIIWYSVLLDHIDLWSALKVAQKNSWWFGYMGYDVKNFIERLESKHPNLYEAADLWFMEPRILAKIPTIGQKNNHGNPVEWVSSVGLNWRSSLWTIHRSRRSSVLGL
jgi:hypothetical protein